MSQIMAGEAVNLPSEIQPFKIQADYPHSFLQAAVLRTVAYGDVFDFPMTAREIWRYLVGLPADLLTVRKLLEEEQLKQQLSFSGEYVCLRGREELASVRQQRERISRRLWPRARRYGRLIAALPFVRMVAVTGSLAVDNPQAQGDIDYLLVSAPGRVWLCRALAILVVRWAALGGDRLCPNYVLSENRLVSSPKDLYNAHELAQMVPLAGWGTYLRMRRLNQWTVEFLPNAGGVPARTCCEPQERKHSWLGRAAEASLSGRTGSRLEQWEMERKVRRFSRQALANEEAGFCADWCKGHFDQHASRSRQAYQERLGRLGLDP